MELRRESSPGGTQPNQYYYNAQALEARGQLQPQNRLGERCRHRSEQSGLCSGVRMSCRNAGPWSPVPRKTCHHRTPVQLDTTLRNLGKKRLEFVRNTRRHGPLWPTPKSCAAPRDALSMVAVSETHCCTIEFLTPAH